MNQDLIRKHIVGVLANRFSDVAAGDLASVTDLIEHSLEIELALLLASFLVDKLGDKAVPAEANNQFIFQRKVHEVMVGQFGLLEPRVLGVAVFPLKRTQTQMSRASQQTFEISGLGKYTNVRVVVSASLSGLVEDLGAMTLAGLTAGYAWLTELIADKVDEFESDLAKAFYRRLRRLFATSSQHALVDKVWMVIIDKDEGFYGVDAGAAKNAISIVTKSKKIVAISPAQLFAHFLTTILPLEDMHSQIAIATGKTIDIDLRDSRYVLSDELFEIAEEYVFGTSQICVHPIVREGEQKLLVGFPRTIKTPVLRVLTDPKNQEEISRIFADHSIRIRKLWKTLKKTAKDHEFSKIGGRFVGEVLSVILEHHKNS